jgi:hypothetical protein
MASLPTSSKGAKRLFVDKDANKEQVVVQTTFPKKLQSTFLFLLYFFSFIELVNYFS